MLVLAEDLQFPEGPIALEDGSVLLVEMARETLTRVWKGGRKEVIAKIPGGPNGAAIGPDGHVVVCNNGGFSWIRENGTCRPHGQSVDYSGGRIERVDLNTGVVERLYDKCDDHGLRGPNDLVFDRFGGFYFTDHGKRRARDMDRGFVYYARADGSEIRQIIEGVTLPNGIGLSPEGDTLYVTETDAGRVWSWELIAPGEVSRKPWPSPNGGNLVAGLPGFIRLDSLAVSQSGKICVAALEDGAIFEIAPDGAVVNRYEFPDPMVTNICFGGAERRTAYVTLSYQGQLYSLPWHEPGLELAY